MKLSIIVPVYNMAADGKLEYCLDSLVNQTIADYEIIAVDDCSTDESMKVLSLYQNKYPEKFIAIHSEVNRRQGGAKNLGLKRAQGEWIGFVDADDWITPNFYETLIGEAEKNDADMAGCDYNLVSEHTFEVGEIQANGREIQNGELKTQQKESLILDGGSLCVKVFKRDRIIRDALFFPEGIFYEDNAMGGSYLLGAKKYVYIPKPMYYYYQHQSSTVHTINLQRSEDRLKACEIMISEAKRLGFYDEVRSALDYKFIILYYTNTVFSYVRSKGWPKQSFIKKVGRGLLETVPDFRENKYFKERINEEEKKMIDLQLKNTFLFTVYYKLLWAYRRLRKG